MLLAVLIRDLFRERIMKDSHVFSKINKEQLNRKNCKVYHSFPQTEELIICTGNKIIIKYPINDTVLLILSWRRIK